MTPAELAAIEAEVTRREVDAGATSHRAFASSPQFCGLDLSPMVAAIMDAAEGRPVTTIDDATCERYFGCKLEGLPRERRRLVGIEAGGRGGKSSRLLATKALHAAWTVPLPTLARNEHAVSLIVSSELVFAKQALSFVVGYVQASPVLSQALVGEPGKESLTLRRPDGRLVDVGVRAAGARGKGGRAFTLVFGAMDEACFFYDDSGVVNDREIFRAMYQRVVPGGQLWMLSTPWIEGVGLLEEAIAKNWGTHTRALVARGIGTRALNPTWDPDGEIEKELREDDPDNAEREIDAKPLTSGSQHFFSREAIEAAFDEKLPTEGVWNAKHTYGAAADTGFRKNSSALAIVEQVPEAKADGRTAPARYVLAYLEEQKPQPGAPLKPQAVCRDFAARTVKYGERAIVVDSHELDEVTEALLESNCTALTAPDKHEAYMLFRSLLHEGRVKLPKNARLRQQLRDVMAKPQPGGGIQISSPKRADGSHGDLVSAVVNAVWRASTAHATVARTFDSPMNDY